MIIKNQIFMILAIISLCSIFFIGCLEKNVVEYQVTFHALWSEETHPDDFPPDPHFSGLIGASHNDKIILWKEGELASPGIKNMAETGSKNPLTEEIIQGIIKRNAFNLISGEGISNSPGSVNITFQVSEKFPFVSLVTMIAPSPDWFVGVDSLNLMDNGSFVEEKTVLLYAYDAGTDSGIMYTSTDLPTTPPQPIFLIEEYPFIYNEELVPIGTFVFVKID